MAAVSQEPGSGVNGPMENGSRKHTTNSSKLEDQAATAALYVTNQQHKDHKDSTAPSKSGQEFLNKHHRLSSAGKCHIRERREGE